jgi:hypothetical protein
MGRLVPEPGSPCPACTLNEKLAMPNEPKPLSGESKEIACWQETKNSWPNNQTAQQPNCSLRLRAYLDAKKFWLKFM